LIASLLDAELLDELRLLVHPIVTGAGRSITGVLSYPRRLQLVASEPAAHERVTFSYRVPRVR
jgi:riboflavin biosynthesis pyrimidine reductase